MKHPLIEICANSTQSAIEAQKGGAGRVELCAAIPEGGTTPSYGEIAIARKNIDILLNVIIRPRGGDFLYSANEVEVMAKDIEIAKELGADGVVFGILTKDGEVDIESCKRLMEASKGMSTTFHRAFDMCSNQQKALEDIISLGFNRILTSGGKATAFEGKERLKELVSQANGRIIIMPGCGVNESNIKELKEFTQATEFHMSVREALNSSMVYKNEDVSMGGTVVIDEYKIDVTSAKRVANCISELTK